MMTPKQVTEDYIAMWHEADPARRRERIAALWSPEGENCNRQSVSRGWDALQTRVTGAWEKWIRDGNYRFRAAREPTSHHNVMKFDWEMATASGERDSGGVSFFVLDADGRILHDYQFNSGGADAPANVAATVDKYIALWNEPDRHARNALIPRLWSADGAYVTETKWLEGFPGIQAEADHAHASYVAKGYVFESAGNADGHHNVMRMRWRMVDGGDGRMAAAGSDLFILDEQGRIYRDFQFGEPV